MTPRSVIKRLVIKNLVLVESCEILFEPHFNTITGETGAGKTALIEAIHLCLGERADSELIRKGCDKGYVELFFSLESLPHIKKRLEEAGLDTNEEELIVRRELSKEGKNRAFINCKAVPLPLLQEIGSALIDLIGQHSHQTLRSSEAQRRLLDLFGDLEEDRLRFQEGYNEEKRKFQRVEALQALCLTKDKNEDLWRFQLEELEKAGLKEGEEATLFAQYEKLSHSQEIEGKIATMTQILAEDPSALLNQLAKVIRLNGSLLSYDPSFTQIAALFQEALISLKEAYRTLECHSQQDLSNPQFLTRLEERLSLIAKLKRKYGATLQEIGAVQRQLEKQLNELFTLSEDLIDARLQLKQAEEHTSLLASTLTTKRQTSAKRLQSQLTDLLQELNMPGATVELRVLPQPRASSGDDHIQFWLQANRGEHPSLVKDHASGGEVSRLLFALKIALAEKNNTPTLVFDEIDSNVGGKTATLIGKKLKVLGHYKQVICITHFPQVASQADTHFQVQKAETEGRTLTHITRLEREETHKELLRMGGG